MHLKKIYEGQKNLWFATSGHFINDYYNGFLSPLLPIIVEKLQLSLLSAGTLMSIFAISNSLLQPLAGLIADRMRRYYFVLFSPIMAAVFMGFIGWVNSYLALLGILCLSGIGTAFFHPQAAALVGRGNHNRQGLAMSTFNTAGVLGVTIGNITIIPIVESFGLKATLYTAIFALAFLLYFVKFVFGEDAPIISYQRRPRVFEIISKHRQIILKLNFLVIVRATLILAFAGFIPLYLTSKGYSVFTGALGLAVFQFSSIAGIFLGGYFFDRWGAKKILIFSFLFILPTTLLFLKLPLIPGLVFLAMMGFSLQSSTAVNIILGQKISLENASFMSSLMMGLGWGIGGLLMTPLGALADRIGLANMFIVVSLFSVIALIIVAFISFPEAKRNQVS